VRRPRARSISHHSVHALLLTTSYASPCFNLFDVPRPCVQRKRSACGAGTPADRSAARADAHLARGAHQNAWPARGARTRRGAVRVCPVPGGNSRSLFGSCRRSARGASDPTIGRRAACCATSNEHTRHGTALLLPTVLRPPRTSPVRASPALAPSPTALRLRDVHPDDLPTSSSCLILFAYPVHVCSAVRAETSRSVGDWRARSARGVLRNARPARSRGRGARCVCACPRRDLSVALRLADRPGSERSGRRTRLVVVRLATNCTRHDTNTVAGVSKKHLHWLIDECSVLCSVLMSSRDQYACSCVISCRSDCQRASVAAADQTPKQAAGLWLQIRKENN
jgi:hypothetical protein